MHHDGLGVCSVALIETHHHTADPNKLREHKPAFDNAARVAAKSVPPSRAHQAAVAVRVAAEMKSKSVSSSESEDSDEGLDPDLLNDDSGAEDYKHEDEDDPKSAAPVVSAIPAAPAPVVLPQIRARNTASLALALSSPSGKGKRRGNRL